MPETTPENTRDREPEAPARRSGASVELAFQVTALADAFRLSNNPRHREAALALADLLADDVLGGPSQRHP